MGSRKDRTITRQTLADAVARASGLPRPDALDLVGQVLATISDALISGETVLLSGFGKFQTVDRAARRARNVRAGHDVLIGPRKALVFKPAIGLVQELSEAHRRPAQPARDFVASA
jgi:nucleoid DNA-binding protein